MTRGPYALAVVVATLCVVAAVTFPIHDPDLWQHLVVGKVIWQTHAIPTTQIWTWPTHGSPDVLPSWLHRALLWPFWELGGLHGLNAWRWLTTLLAFGLMFLATRRMGATGVAPLVMLAWCALFWRERSQMRPETLAAVLLAAQVLLLESRRQAAGRTPDAARPAPADAAAAMQGVPGLIRDPAWWIVPIALVWANAHISYYLGFIVSGGYLLDDLLRRREGRRPAPLALAIAAAALASFANPFGWRTLVQPLQYFTTWRHEPVYQSIGELFPVWSYWDQHILDGLALWLPLVVLGALLRWRARGLDAAQALLLLVCLTQALTTQRFLGYAALTLAPFAARDFGDLVSRWRSPAWLHAPWRRAALAALAGVVLVLPTLVQRPRGFGYGFTPTLYPERASDWIAGHDVRGRSFNAFWFGGYLLHRFYPDPGRLPFMDIHQAGTKEIRYLYAFALQDPAAWQELERSYRIDWVLLPASLAADPDLNDFLDADTTWALVFADDATTLWLRRDGSCAEQARRFAYHHMPGGPRALGALGAAIQRDPRVRIEAAEEFARAMAESPYNSRAHTLQGNLDLFEGDFASARAHFDEAARLQPDEPEIRPRQGLARLHAGDPRGALEAFRKMRRLEPDWEEADFREGQALMAMGRREQALELWRRSVEKHPGFREARDSLERAGR